MEAARRFREGDSVNARMPVMTQMLGEAGVARVYLQYTGVAAQRRLRKLRFLTQHDQLTTPDFPAESRHALIRFVNDLIDTRVPRWGSGAENTGHLIWDLEIDMVIHGRSAESASQEEGK